MHARRCLGTVAAALALAGCGASDEPPATEPQAAKTHVRLYYLDDDARLRPVAGEVEGGGVAAQTLRALLANEARATTAIPEGTELEGLVVVDGVATVDLTREFESGGGSTSMQARVAQVVYTLTQWPSIHTVTIELEGEAVEAIGGEGVPARALRRADVGEALPPILVELPLPGSTAVSPLRVSGDARVFEANVSLRLEADGRALAEGFATASEGAPGRGEFTAMLDFDVDGPTDATLVAFEASARDGSETNVVRVPVRLCPPGTNVGC